MSITQSIVEICQSSAGGRRILSVVVQIGGLAGVVPSAIEFCFEACTRDTPLEGARLVIEEVPPHARCPECGACFAVSGYYDPCPSCGTYGVEVLSGDELRVKELEVE